MKTANNYQRTFTTSEWTMQIVEPESSVTGFLQKEISPLSRHLMALQRIIQKGSVSKCMHHRRKIIFPLTECKHVEECQHMNLLRCNINMVSADIENSFSLWSFDNFVAADCWIRWSWDGKPHEIFYATNECTCSSEPSAKQPNSHGSNYHSTFLPTFIPRKFFCVIQIVKKNY